MAVSLQTSDVAVRVPANVVVPAGQDRVTFHILTSPVPARVVANITGTQAGTARTVTLIVQPATFLSLTMAPTSFLAGQATTATVTLSGPAFAGGVNVALENLSAFTSSPAQITIPAGATTASFPIPTKFVDATSRADVRATVSGVSRIASVLLYPPITTFGVTPTSQVGGVTATLRLAIPFVAPTGGTEIALASSNPAVVTLPASVVIPAGSASLILAVPTKIVTTSANVTLTATRTGYSRSVTLSAVPR